MRPWSFDNSKCKLSPQNRSQALTWLDADFPGIPNKFCQFGKPRRASSRNQGSIDNALREEWGLPRGVLKELKTMSLWPGKMSITSWKKGLQSVLTSAWTHNAAQDTCVCVFLCNLDEGSLNNAMYWLGGREVFNIYCHAFRDNLQIADSAQPRQSFPQPALQYSLEGCSVTLVLLEHHLGLVK